MAAHGYRLQVNQSERAIRTRPFTAVLEDNVVAHMGCQCSRQERQF